MNNISEQVLSAIDILVDNKISKLEFDKTIQAIIKEVVDLNTGEYKVQYNNNIFSAFAQKEFKPYKVNDLVYVTVPENNFSNKKLITSLVTKNSLSYDQLNDLQTAVFPLSPTFDKLYNDIYNPQKEYGVIAGIPQGEENSYIYIYQGQDEYNKNDYHALFQEYSKQFEYIRIEASFLTQFYSEHNYGNYGLQLEFFAQGTNDIDVVTFTLDLNSFNGDPYRFQVYSPQSIIIKTSKNYLLGLKSIKLFEENFEYDITLDHKENRNISNIFVKNISIQYVNIKDLTDTNYYLNILAPQGTVFTSTVSTLDLIGQLIYQGQNIMSSNTKCTWYERDLSIYPGKEEYDKNAGFGWKPLLNSNNILTLFIDNVKYKQRYKLVAIYNDTTVLSAEIEIINSLNQYFYHIQQNTDKSIIYLNLINDLDNRLLVGDWYLSYPDGTYIELKNEKLKDKIIINEYLKYPNIVFYCSVYDYEQKEIIDTLQYTIVETEEQADLAITYSGEDIFRYDANGDVTVEDSERERGLSFSLIWRDGIAATYNVSWYMRNALNQEVELNGHYYKPDNSMIEKLWVDNSNNLHYNIKQKYKITDNNNILIIKIKTVTGKEYKFYKEILFIKDGDQGTNGTTYVVAIRPYDSNELKLSGFYPLIYNNGWQNTLPLKCFVYKNGEPINDNKKYNIYYSWSSSNISLISEEKADKKIAQGMGVISNTSTSKDLQFFVKVKVDITDGMENNKRVSIYTSYPIDVIVGNLNISLVDISNIPSYIQYSSSGVNPYFYNNSIDFIYNNNKLNDNIKSLNTNILDIEEKNNLYYLKPPSSFMYENITTNNESSIGILKLIVSNNQYIIHPIMMYLNVYGNEAINGWDGTALEIDPDKQYLFAPQVGAGQKDPDNSNRFTGVVMGKDSGQVDKYGNYKIGLYGYQSGVSTFGLMQDGTAYFGAYNGGGQIRIDGRSAIISGGGVIVDSSGKPILAENGMYIQLANQSATSTTPAIVIGNNKFSVNYDGALISTYGKIAGWTIDDYGLYSQGGDIYLNANDGSIQCNELNASAGMLGAWIFDNKILYCGSGDSQIKFEVQDADFEWTLINGRRKKVLKSTGAAAALLGKFSLGMSNGKYYFGAGGKSVDEMQWGISGDNSNLCFFTGYDPNKESVSAGDDSGIKGNFEFTVRNNGDLRCHYLTVNQTKPGAYSLHVDNNSAIFQVPIVLNGKSVSKWEDLSDTFVLKTDYDNKIAELESKINTRITSLEGQVSSLNSEMSSKDSEINSLKSTITQLRQEIANLGGDPTIGI